MKTVHCCFCSQEVKVNAGGRVVPHRVGKQRCCGSGAIAKQVASQAARLLAAAQKRQRGDRQ